MRSNYVVDVSRIAAYFGGKAGYFQAVKELEDALYTENEAG